MRFDRNKPDYKPCPPAATRRMQNNPLETKRPHRDKVGTKAAAVAKKAVQGAYYRHLSGKRFQVKIHRGARRPALPTLLHARPTPPTALPTTRHPPLLRPHPATRTLPHRHTKQAFKEFDDGIYLSDRLDRLVRYLFCPAQRMKR